MAAERPNPLLSTSKPSDSPLTVKLHPLVLLTITDFITRHSLIQKEGPIVGAAIGLQNGREVTVEHAFESTVEEAKSENADGQRLVMGEPWFGERLAQYKEVHSSPQLDLTAAFTLGSTQGPAPEHVPFVQQLKANYNDDVVLILFHPETVLDGSLTGGKLPITLYESFYEPGTENGDKGLQLAEYGMGTQLQLKFRQIPFEVETGEAEMIAVDYVAKGAANANIAVDTGRKPSTAPSLKGKEKAVVADDTPEHTLSAEDEELIASLTSKTNAIKMLQSRVSLIKSYLASLPPSYLSDSSLGPSADTNLNHQLLRQISSLLSRLPLLTASSSTSDLSPLTHAPNDQSSPATERAAKTTGGAEKDEVALTTLLAQLTKTLGEARELAQKANVVNGARDHKRAVGLAKEAGIEGPMQGGGSFGVMKLRGNRGGGIGGGGEGWEEDVGGFDSGADGVDGEL